MQLWTPDHTRTLLPAFVLMLALAAVLHFALKNRSHKIRMIPLQIIAVLLVLLEIGKQAFSLSRGYDLYCLPFHFCSLFIFMLPIMAFYKGKHQNTVYGITGALTMSVCVLMMIYPDLIYSAGNIQAFFTDFFSFHTVVFHNLVLFAALLIPALQIHQPQPKGEAKSLIFFMLGFCAVSATMAQLLKTNFNNFYVCNIAPLEVVRQSVEAACGPVVAMILYVLIVSALDLAFTQGCYWIYRMARKLVGGKKELQKIS